MDQTPSSRGSDGSRQAGNAGDPGAAGDEGAERRISSLLPGPEATATDPPGYEADERRACESTSVPPRSSAATETDQQTQVSADALGRAFRISPPLEVEVLRRWQISFTVIGRACDRMDGILHLNPSSRWMTLRDPEDDILAGGHLLEQDRMEAGVFIIIDIFNICIGSQILQEGRQDDDPMEIIDLSADQFRDRKDKIDLPRVGGRFWVLAEDDEDEVSMRDEVAEVDELPLPIPAQTPVEATSSSKGAMQTDSTRVVNRGSATIKPWKGPLPKVNLPPLYLSDYFLRETWTTVMPRKKKKGRVVRELPAPAATAPMTIDPRL